MTSSDCETSEQKSHETSWNFHLSGRGKTHPSELISREQLCFDFISQSHTSSV